MEILPIKTPIIKPGDALATILQSNMDQKDGDIIILSSKVVSMAEGNFIHLPSLKITEEATLLSKKCDQTPAFTQAIINEVKRMNGTIDRVAPTVLLTSLKPDGMNHGRILCPNAGLDLSNIESGYAIGWPRDLVESTRMLWGELRCPGKTEKNKKKERTERIKKIGIILSDSTCKPGRLGVTAFALTCAGIDPVKNEKGRKDLFDRALSITNEAIADQLATAGNFLMGNANQSIPAVIIRDHGLPFTNFCGWIDGIEPNEDIYGM